MQVVAKAGRQLGQGHSRPTAGMAPPPRSARHDTDPALNSTTSVRLAAAAGVVLAIAAATVLMRRPAQPAPADHPAPSASGSTLTLPEAQWRTLDVQAAAPADFPTVLVADATVAVDNDRTVPVFSPATGRVIALDAAVGQHVMRGAVLARVAGAETAQAVADLSTAEATEHGSAAQLTLARAAERRASETLAAGGGTEKDWQQRQADLASALAADQSAHAATEAARTKAAAVGLDAATGAAAATAVRAPIAGEVIQRQVAAGQFVASLASNAGGAPLFTVSDLGRVWVLASVPEADAGRVQAGQEADVTVLGNGGAPLRSRVSWVAPVLDPQTRRLAFRVELANPEGRLRPQMTAEVRLRQAGARGLAIPTLAIVRDGARAHCYVVTGERTLATRELQLGRTEGDRTEVLAGLREGERVIARGALFVDAMAQGS